MENKVREITAITHATPYGQRFDMIRIQYDCIPSGEDMKSAFAVTDRTILDAYTENSSVILKLNSHEDGALELRKLPLTEKQKNIKANYPVIPETAVRLPYAEVRQIIELSDQEGMKIPVWKDFLPVQKAEEELVDLFESGHRYRLGFNLFKPALQKGQKVPLVVFIPDAGVNGADPRIALLQGGGGTLFASEHIQNDFPCYVLVFQIPSGIPFTTDNFTTANEFEDIEKIIDEITQEFSIDTQKIYLTGQSQGCMSCCELLLRNPEKYQAALLVAGQWNPDRIAEKLTDTNIWIFVSDGDEKAYPIMGRAVRMLEENGVKVGRSFMNAKAPEEIQESDLAKAAAEDTHTRFTVFTNHSVVPDGVVDNGGTNHINTWPCVYRFDFLRRWLLQQ